jgi:hypothetical protein
MRIRIMDRYPQDHSEGKPEARREEFADGSALVTYRDDGMSILESALAKTALFGEAGLGNYNEPSLAPGGTGRDCPLREGRFAKWKARRQKVAYIK